MADIPTNLRTFLLTRTAITNIVGANIHQGVVPENREVPYVWFARIGTAQIELLTPDVGLEPGMQAFTVECVAGNIDQAQALGDAMRAVNNYRSTFGDTTVQGIFVNDQSDDYEYRTLYGDEGFDSCAFTLEIFPN